jgi:hypothetical protein
LSRHQGNTRQYIMQCSKFIGCDPRTSAYESVRSCVRNIGLALKSAGSKQTKTFGCVKSKRMLTVSQNVGFGSVHLFTLNATIFKFVRSICHSCPRDIAVHVIRISYLHIYISNLTAGGFQSLVPTSPSVHTFGRPVTTNCVVTFATRHLLFIFASSKIKKML